MKQLTNKFFLLFTISILALACAKETSFESGLNIGGKSIGTLKDNLGNCQDIVVHGTYLADSTLKDDNYVLVKVNITTPGQYNITTDTSNGFWFRDTGYTSAGLQTIKLKGYGKPILPLNTDFVVTYNNSFCTFTVTLGATVTPTVISDYFPTSVGSNWAYDMTGFTDTLHLEATPLDKTFAGNAYRVFRATQAVSPDDSSYFRKSGGNYYQYNTLDNYSSPVETIFLKENQPVATQWDSPTATTTISSLVNQVKIHYTLLAVNTSMTINGFALDSIIKVQNDVQYKNTMTGNFQTISTYYSYFAKNIGLVLMENPGVLTQTIHRWKIY